MADKTDYRQILTDKLIEHLEAGTAPWQKPWDAREGSDRLPFNPVTGKEYRGANSLYLTMDGRSDPRWATYKQATEQGWQVRKGEKGSLIEYWKFSDSIPAVDSSGKPILGEDGKQKTISARLDKPKVFRAVVFNAEQMDGVPELSKAPRQYEWDPIERADAILQSSGARLFHDQADRAFYNPAKDEIHLPGRDQFKDSAAYYATALHELGHWTGHETRLSREFGTSFGSIEYAKEELRAELSSYFMADKLGIPHDPGQHAAYVKSWIRVLQEDKNEIFRAARDAEKIVEHVAGLAQEKVISQVNDLSNNPAHELTLAQIEKQHGLSGDAPAEPERLLTLEPIRRNHFEGDGRNVVQEAVAHAVEADPDKFIERFQALPQSLNGRFISADTFKETFDQYRESNEARNIYNSPVHNAAAVLANEQLRRVLQEVPEPDRNTVVLLTGIPGAGKTSSVLEAGYLPTRAHAIYEGQMAEPDTAIAKVQMVLDAGFKPVIVAAHATPEQALDNTLQRFDDVGRGASINTMARIQGNLPEGLAAVRDKFGDAVELRISDRRNFADQRRLHGWEHLSTLESEGNHEHIKQRLEQHLETRRNDISADAWRQAAGLAPIVRSGRDHGPSGEEHDNPVRERSAAQRDSEDVGLNQPAQGRTTLLVSFTEKDAAKALGAKWDKDAKVWYAPPGADLAKLDKWLVKPEIPAAPQVNRPEVDFAVALKENGLVIDGLPIMDGKIHRVPIEGKGPRSKDGAYVGFLDGKPSGFIQNFSAGTKTSWTQSGTGLTPEEQAQMRVHIQLMKEQRESELATLNAAVAEKSVEKWQRLGTVKPDGHENDYLKRKGVMAVNVRENGGKLVVPLRDIDGKLWSLQTISNSEGAPKIFEKGGLKNGNFSVFSLDPKTWDTGAANIDVLASHKPSQPILVAEGYATAATIGEATKETVVVAFDSGNIDPVIEALKTRFPMTPIFICADNDHQLKNNVGVEKAWEAAEKHQVGIVIPEFVRSGSYLSVNSATQTGTDFNDLALANGSNGKQVVADQIEPYIQGSMRKSREVVAAKMGFAMQPAKTCSKSTCKDRGVQR